MGREEGWSTPSRQEVVKQQFQQGHVITNTAQRTFSICFLATWEHHVVGDKPQNLL